METPGINSSRLRDFQDDHHQMAMAFHPPCNFSLSFFPESSPFPPDCLSNDFMDDTSAYCQGAEDQYKSSSQLESASPSLSHLPQPVAMDDEYLSLIANPPLYVNYLTDINRNASVLGPPLQRMKPAIQMTPSISLKRRHISIPEVRHSKRRSGSEAEPASPQSCCTKSEKASASPALNTNLKPRAKQGTATDPQSIAARQRRERISERLKVLQSLVPNGSKVDLVTMLEKAINYVKFMQLQIQVLSNEEHWPKQAWPAHKAGENHISGLEEPQGESCALPDAEDVTKAEPRSMLT